MKTIVDRQRIANNLKMLRVLYNLTQAQVSSVTGISRNTLAGYERSGEISPARLKILADYYEVPVEFMTMTWNKVRDSVPRGYVT